MKKDPRSINEMRRDIELELYDKLVEKHGLTREKAAEMIGRGRKTLWEWAKAKEMAENKPVAVF